MRKLIVNEKNNGKKIIDFLISSFPNLSKNTIYKALRKKDIRINDKKISDNEIVYLDDTITIYIVDEQLLGSNKKIDILYEDDNVIAINKEAGISVTANEINETTLTTLVKQHCPTAEPCHRLDRNTSGIVLFSKNNETLEILLQKFKKHEIEKRYKAMVYGIPNPKEAKLHAYLFKDSKDSIVYISDIPKTNYQEIITNYKVIETNKEKNYSILDISIETGRTHQIRAHLAHIGHFIIGDSKYGNNKINKAFKKNMQCLTAYKIKFTFTTDAGILNYLNNIEIHTK